MNKNVIIFLVISFFGCSKDENITPPDIERQLIFKISHTDNEFPINSYEQFYTYDSQDRTTSVKKFDINNELGRETVYLYNQDTTKTYTYYRSELEKYSVMYLIDQGSTKRQDLYGITRNKPDIPYDSITYLGYTLIFSNDCDKAIRTEDYLWNGNAVGYKTLTYTDENGSYLQETFSLENDLLFKTEVIKNDKIAFSNQETRFECFFRSPIEWKSWINEDLIFNTKLVYEYDENNYPLSSIQTAMNGTSREYFYEYY